MEQLTYDVPGLADALHISLTSAYQLCRRADFPSVRLGGRWVIPVRPLEEWLARQATEKAPCAYLAKSAQRTETPQTVKKGLRLS